MKRVLSFFLSLMLIVTMAGCNNLNKNSQNNTVKSGQIVKSDEKTIDYKAVLYFSDNDAKKIVKEERNIKISEKLDNVKIAQKCVEELIRGPKNTELIRTIPESVKVLSVIQDKDSFVIDLSKEFDVDNVGGSTGTIMSVAPIVMTLTEFEGIKQILFKVDGKSVNDFKGHLSFEKPITRDEYSDLLEK